jgi:hypothetical protein
MFLTPGSRVIPRGGKGVSGDFPRKTSMVFYNAAAPLGWTKQVINDYTLRVVSGSGGVLGGSIAFSTAFNGSGVTGSKTLSASDTPSANVTLLGYEKNTGVDLASALGATSGPWKGGSDYQTANNFTTTSATNGAGGSHSHTLPALAYADVIIATKD